MNRRIAMTDELYYDDSNGSWTARLWSDQRPNPEVEHVNIPEEIEDKLDCNKMYECDTEERDGELWVIAVGEAVAESE